jgi:RHS repeat-associated protein
MKYTLCSTYNAVQHIRLIEICNLDFPSWLYRGYTGHEMLQEFALINMNNRMYDPVLGRMLAADNLVQDSYSTQAYNRYSYGWNNPVTYVDPNGDELVTALVITGVALTGAYIGGRAANGGEARPWKWNWRSGNTYGGILIGGAVGAAAGYGLVAAAPALAGTAFFSHFANGAVVAYTLTGSVFVGGAGYVAGFSGAMLYTKGHLKYSHQAGVAGALTGSVIGGSIGALFGISSSYAAHNPVQQNQSTPSGSSAPSTASASTDNSTGLMNSVDNSSIDYIFEAGKTYNVNIEYFSGGMKLGGGINFRERMTIKIGGEQISSIDTDISFDDDYSLGITMSAKLSGTKMTFYKDVSGHSLYQAFKDTGYIDGMYQGVIGLNGILEGYNKLGGQKLWTIDVSGYGGSVTGASSISMKPSWIY